MIKKLPVTSFLYYGGVYVKTDHGGITRLNSYLVRFRKRGSRSINFIIESLQTVKLSFKHNVLLISDTLSQWPRTLNKHVRLIWSQTRTNKDKINSYSMTTYMNVSNHLVLSIEFNVPVNQCKTQTKSKNVG